MGFLTGRLVGEEEESGVCRNYMDKDYCGEDGEPITVAGINCQGLEKSITECGAAFDTENCNHDQDVIIECEGGEGDTSGINALLET